MKNILAHGALHTRQRYSGHEKASIVYLLILLIVFMITPLIKIDHINMTSGDQFTIFNAAMTKTYMLILLCIAFLIAWNSSYKWKQRLHRTFGINGSPTLTNAGVLFMILCMLFSMGDTLSLLNQNFSFRIGATNGFLVLGVLLIAGIAWQLAAARVQWKKQMASEGITIKQETDTSKKERDFKQMEKEFEGLFGEETNNQE